MQRTIPASLSAYLNDSYCLTRTIRANTLRQYQISVLLFERWSGGPVPLSELTEDHVSRWLRDYSEHVSAATVRAKRCHILTLWRAAAEDFPWAVNPPTRRVRSARVPWRAVECWTRAEVEKLLDAAKTLPRWHPCGLRRAQWFDLAIRVAWDSGLRWGDQIKLPVSAVRPDGWVTVSQSKTGRPVTFRLSDTTLAALRLSLDEAPRKLVTPWSGSCETFTAQVRRLVDRAGIRRGSWKWLRRASSTDCELQAAGAGSAHLGHAPGSRIAEQSYLDPAILGRRGVVPTPLKAG